MVITRNHTQDVGGPCTSNTGFYNKTTVSQWTERTTYDIVAMNVINNVITK